MAGDRSAVSLGAVIDRFLASARCRNPNTRRAYAAALDRLSRDLGPHRVLAEVSGDEFAAVVEAAWGTAAGATWNRNRAAVASFLIWASKNRYPARALPERLERRPERRDETRALSRAEIERQLSRRELPLREKTLWRMLYETAARASEILALDIADLDLPTRRARIVAKGGATEYVYWASGTAHLLPRLLRGRTTGPVFLTERRPGPGPAAPRPRPVPRHRPGPPRLRPRPGSARPAHRLGPAPIPPLRRHPPRRGQRPPPGDHGEDPPPQPPHRHALHPPQRRDRRPDHRRAPQPRPRTPLMTESGTAAHGVFRSRPPPGVTRRLPG